MKRLPDLSIRWKLVLLVMIVGVLPTIISGILMQRDSRRQVDESARQLLESRATALGARIDDFHASLQRGAGRLSRMPDIEAYLAAAPAERRQLQAKVQREIEAFAGPDPRLRGEALFGADGVALVTSEPALLGRNNSFRPYFRDAMQGQRSSGQMYVSVPELGNVPSIAFAAPVSAGGKVVGVAVLFARAAWVWDLVRTASDAGGDGSYAVLLDQYGVRIAHSSAHETVFHPAGRLPPEEIDRMVAEQRFGGQTRQLLESPIGLDGGFERARGAALPRYFETWSAVRDTSALALAERLHNAPWTMVSLVPRSSLRAPVTRVIWQGLATNAVVIALALGFGLVWGRVILRPVNALADAALAIEKGDLKARVPESRGDELGRLGRVFNQMAASLAAAQEQLELQVRRRTEALAAAKADLEQKNASLEQRTAELTERQARDVAFARTLSALSGPGPMRDALGAALGEAEQYLKPLLLVCYRIDGELLAPLASRGGEAQPVRITGRVQEALTARKPALVPGLPEDAQLRFDAAFASGKPACAVLVPLTMGTRDVGLLAAGFGAPPTPSQQSFLADLSLPIALAMGRHELHEQTERFALQLAQRNEALREQSEQLASKQGELEQKNREIARANDMKSEFLANMSHELRTPLNAVIGFSELLLEEQHRLLPGHVQFVKDILASGRHLLILINSVLDLAKIESGRVALEVAPLDPGLQIAAACTLLSALAQRKSIAISQVVATRRSVLADRSKLQQILINLLSNAIKFSETHKSVEVGVEDHGAQLRFWVEDHGPGIPELLRPELFKPFVQGEATLSKKHEGTGLGLAITRRLVEYQGGDVGVDTEVGKGSTFWFTLPGDERPAAALAPLPAPTEPPAVQPLPVAETTLPRKPLVLIIEDDPANARLLRFHLESAGYAVAEAKRVAESLELVRRLRPQVVLLDLILPEGEDGLNVLRALKNDQQTVSTPVIVVSVVQETRRARELGAAECFVKPVDGVKLVEAVQRVCPAPAALRSRATVLVVDDHDLNRELARTLLERRGCRVLLARNGAEGARVAKVEKPDLVLMDLAMPVKDGITAARELKADPATAQIPLIAFTALAMRGDEERARKAGFDGYLTKPLETQALDATLEKFLTPPARA
ncbi:MAG TPA: response regulator [Myxococcales bacterium]|nr:response regulator [Myxococcales bacterium]